jgi:hypothetical protein
MAFDLTVADVLLKEFFLPGLREVLNLGTPMFSQLKRNTDDIEGKEAKMVLHTALNEGVGARGEWDELPDAGEPEFKEATLPLRYQYARLKLSGPSMTATRSKAASFARAMEVSVTDLQNSLKRDLERQVFGDGFGKLCLVNGAVTNGATIVVDGGLSALDGTTRRIRRNMILDIWNAAGTALTATGVKVSSVTDAQTFVLTSQVSAENDGIVTRSGVRTASVGKEFGGLATMVVGSGALYGLNPATAGEEFWKAHMNTTGGALDIMDMLALADEIGEDVGEKPNLILTTDGMIRQYFDMLTDEVRINTPLELAGGYRAVSFYAGGREIPMLPVYDQIKGRMDFLNMKDISLYEQTDFTWLNQDGSILRKVPNVDAWQAELALYANIGTTRRNAHGAMTDLTEPS